MSLLAEKTVRLMMNASANSWWQTMKTQEDEDGKFDRVYTIQYS